MRCHGGKQQICLTRPLVKHCKKYPHRRKSVLLAMQQLADWNLFWEKDEAIINHQLFAKVKKNLLTSRVKDILQKQTSSCPLILFLYYSAHIQAFAPSSDLLSFRRQKWPNKAFIIDSTQTKSGEGNQKSDDYVPWNYSIIGSSKIADLNFKTPSKLFLANGTADEKVKSLLVIWNEKDPYYTYIILFVQVFIFTTQRFLFLKMSWVVASVGSSVKRQHRADKNTTFQMSSGL